MPSGDMRRSAAWEKKRDRGVALVKALRESGQTVARFCEAQGVSICSTDPVYRGARSRGRLGAWQTQQRGSAGWRSGGRAG